MTTRYRPYPAYKDSGVEWLGKVPEGWEVKRMKSIIRSAQNGFWGEEPDGGVDDVLCARVADFDRIRLSVDDNLPTSRKVPEEQRKARVVEFGDLLFEKSGGGEINTVGAIVRYIGSAPIICSNFVAVVKCVKEIESQWFCYANAHIYSVGINKRSIKQTTGIQNIDSEDYFSERVAVPDQCEQRRIASHLDRETARIDALVEKKGRFLELLREKRQALITHAVTKGLDATVPLKDSGVEWLGQVPEHWAVKKILYWIDGYGSGTTPSSDGDYCDEGHPWVTTGELRENIVLTTEKCVTSRAIEVYSALRLHPMGSLVVAMYGATVGRLGMLGCDASLNQACFAIHPSRNVDVSLLRWWFEGFRMELIELATGAGQPNISGDKIRNLVFACPADKKEQAEILAVLDRETSRIDSLIEKTQRSIELLKERRCALITAAVTGQIDLREVCA